MQNHPFKVHNQWFFFFNIQWNVVGFVGTSSLAFGGIFPKVGDGNPLKLWKASVEVEAPPSVVLNRVLRERHLWDEDFVQWKVVETLDKQTEIYQYVLNSMAPHPSRDFVVLR